MNCTCMSWISWPVGISDNLSEDVMGVFYCGRDEMKAPKNHSVKEKFG